MRRVRRRRRTIACTAVRSLPCSTSTQTSVREWALSGIWGREVHLIADHAKYVRAPAGANEPLSMWSNRWSTMPLHAHPDLRLAAPRRPRRARSHARLDGAGDPPAVHGVRRPAVLGVHRVRCGHARVRPRRGSRRRRRPRRREARARGSRACCTTRSSRWKRPTTNSCASATSAPRQVPGEFVITAVVRHG